MSDRSPISGRPLPSSFDDDEDFYNESAMSKITRKLTHEPLIPVGCALTVAAFTAAYRAMRRGDHARVQRMFRARIAAQGFTIVAMVAGGIYLKDERHREKELWRKQKNEAEDVKRQKWIKELEARDEEEKALKERLERRQKRRGADSGPEPSAADSPIATAAAEAAAARKAEQSGAAAVVEPNEELQDGNMARKQNKADSSLSSLGSWFGRSGNRVDAPGPQTKGEGSRALAAKGGDSIKEAVQEEAEVSAKNANVKTPSDQK